MVWNQPEAAAAADDRAQQSLNHPHPAGLRPTAVLENTCCETGELKSCIKNGTYLWLCIEIFVNTLSLTWKFLKDVSYKNINVNISQIQKGGEQRGTTTIQVYSLFWNVNEDNEDTQHSTVSPSLLISVSPNSSVFSTTCSSCYMNSLMLHSCSSSSSRQQTMPQSRRHHGVEAKGYGHLQKVLEYILGLIRSADTRGKVFNGFN